MRFAKLHGLGNDFLVADEQEAGNCALGALASRICERHMGVGADGILYYLKQQPNSNGDFSFRVFNADGSEAEMSGNGIRCLAAYLHQADLYRHSEVRLSSISGTKALSLVQYRGNVYTYRCSMGAPILDPCRIPFALTAGSGPVIDLALTAGGDTLSVTITSMGNPHCTTFWNDLSQAPIDRLGPALERHPAFPNRANVEFVQVLDAHTLRVRFWERGVGRTLASGTGSSAAGAAAILRRCVVSPVTVKTDLGDLRVEWVPGADLFLTGPAEFICSGVYEIPEELANSSERI